MTPVKSSNIAAVGRDGDNLHVRFTNGATHEYTGAGSHYDAMLKAPSVGKYFHTHVRSNKAYPSKKV